MTEVGAYRSIKLEVLRALLKPLVRFCIRHSHSVQDFVKIAKTIFVAVAEEEMRKAGKKVTMSRLAVMTGLHRDEVGRIIRSEKERDPEPRSILDRVIGQWRNDKRFNTKSGEPMVLSHGQFEELVNLVSKNPYPGTVLSELKRLGYVEETPKGLKMLIRVFSHQADPRAGFGLLGQDIDSLIISAEENLLGNPQPSNLHIRTAYDNVSKDDLQTIRAWLLQEGQIFHRRAREFLSSFDKDINPTLADKVGGGQVVLTAFGLTSPSGETPGK